MNKQLINSTGVKFTLKSSMPLLYKHTQRKGDDLSFLDTLNFKGPFISGF